MALKVTVVIAVVLIAFLCDEVRGWGCRPGTIYSNGVALPSPCANKPVDNSASEAAAKAAAEAKKAADARAAVEARAAAEAETLAAAADEKAKKKNPCRQRGLRQRVAPSHNC